MCCYSRAGWLFTTFDGNCYSVWCSEASKRVQEVSGNTTVAGGDDDADDAIPVFDLAPFLQSPIWEDPENQAICEKLASCLRDTGCIIVRDPRVGTADSEGFLDLMEQYFGQTHEAKMNDARPEVFYQVQSRIVPPSYQFAKSALPTRCNCCRCNCCCRVQLFVFPSWLSLGLCWRVLEAAGVWSMQVLLSKGL